MTTFTEKVEELLVNFLNDVVGDYAQKVAGERVSINIDNPEVKQALTNMLAPTQQALLKAHQAEISRVLERVEKTILKLPTLGEMEQDLSTEDVLEAINKIKGEYNNQPHHKAEE